MAFVKIGDTWFNPNLVTDIRRDREDSYRLYFAAPQQKGKGPGEGEIRARSVRFRGEEAELFEKWLSEYTTDPSDEENGTSGQGSQPASEEHVGF